ncbi:unnamed protein product [Prorocentrum cordatum]|uniref:Uncharacterized protein n=1 Tax=Prorocentrum cordatum TaxID=2364126 RepID=A0ABN9SI87_9DINO|nr:unnamed protein product [Polarella glacialis]
MFCDVASLSQHRISGSAACCGCCRPCGLGLLNGPCPGVGWGGRRRNGEASKKASFFSEALLAFRRPSQKLPGSPEKAPALRAAPAFLEAHPLRATPLVVAAALRQSRRGTLVLFASGLSAGGVPSFGRYFQQAFWPSAKGLANLTSVLVAMPRLCL